MTRREPRRGHQNVLMCPKHRTQELESAGGRYHANTTGWCPKCNAVVTGNWVKIDYNRNRFDR